MRASAAAAGLPTEEIETKVALIQALIPLGLEAVDAEATRWPAPSTAGRVDAAAWSAGDSNQARSTSRIRSCPSRSLESVIASRAERSR